ncbi:MAG: hypothetical protein ACREPM_09670 [Gemmatimonadaceae bacterium]
MSLGWVAGAIRGRALARRRLGDDGVRALGAQHSLRDALRLLSASSYGHDVRGDMDAPSARLAVAATALWHLRVLAGWLPPGGARLVSAVAGWFELENIEGKTLKLATENRWRERPHALGALASVWPKVADAATLEQVRAALASSDWGDPGADTIPAMLLGVHLGWARRFRDVLRQSHSWSDGALAIAIAKARFAQGARAPASTSELPRVVELGTRWSDAETLRDFATVVPASARWPLATVHDPSDLWRAERVWWTQIDHDAMHLLRNAGLGRTTVIAAAALLVSYCWRTQAAVSRAARGLTDMEHDRGEA